MCKHIPSCSITLEGVGGIFRRWCLARGSVLLQVSLPVQIPILLVTANTTDLLL